MTEEKKNDEILVSKEEVFDVIKFASAMYGYGYNYNLLTPDLLNQRIKDISFNPLSPTSANITDALNNAKNSEEQLRDYIEFFEILSMPLKRIFSYMTSHLALDLQYTVKNTMKDDEYNSNKYLKDKEILYEYFDKFDYRASFRNIAKQLLRNEICVVTPREDKETIVLQELPLQYCKITAKGRRAPLVSFNFYYFIQPGVDINLYPDFYKRKYVELFGGKDDVQKYNPSLPPELRGNSEYNFWVDLPPTEGWVFKLDTSLMTAVPYFSAMLPLLINDQTMIALQKNINMASAAKILFGEVPMRKDEKGASVADMVALSPIQLGQFMALAKSAVGDAIKVSAAPLENMQSFSFDGDTDLLSKWIQTSLSMSGMDTSLIYSMQTKANLVDSQLSFESDSKIMEQQLYPQFAAFLDYWANIRTSKYKYRFRLEGNDYYLNRTQRFDRAMQLSDKGIVLPQMISSAIGLLPQEFERMLQESRATGFADKLTPIISGFQMSGKDSGGRPTESDSELGEAGAQTRETGSNEVKKLK